MSSPRLVLFIIVSSFQEIQRAGLGTGRRWTSLKQHPKPPPGFEPQTESSTPSTASPLPEPTPKKSNWEVIEHFTGGNKGKGSLSSSLIAVRKFNNI